MTATITATPQPTSTPPRVRLDISTDQTSLVLYRVGQDGTKTPVRTYDGGPLPVTGPTVVAYDPEMPFGQPVSYTADGAGVTGSATVTVTSSDVWLVPPGTPSRAMPVTIATVSDKVSPANQSVRYPLARRYPIVASDGIRKADTYTLTIRTTGPDELAALKSILSDLSPLLLNVPPAKAWLDMDTEYVAVGDLTRANPVRFAAFDYREWKLPCSAVARPGGGTQAFNTYGTSAALYATYGARKAAAATYGQAFNP